MTYNQLEAFADEFQKPIYVDSHEYFMYNYITIEEMGVSKYELYYIRPINNIYLQNIIINKIFSILIELKIIPISIECLVPDINLHPTYFAYSLSCVELDFITFDSRFNGLKTEIPTNNYINFYERRCDKLPFINYQKKSQDFIIEYNWIKSVVV